MYLAKQKNHLNCLLCEIRKKEEYYLSNEKALESYSQNLLSSCMAVLQLYDLNFLMLNNSILLNAYANNVIVMQIMSLLCK